LAVVLLLIFFFCILGLVVGLINSLLLHGLCQLANPNTYLLGVTIRFCPVDHLMPGR
jgi:hypothetical protein